MPPARFPTTSSATIPLFAVTVDVAVFTIQHDAQQVLLIERIGAPFQPGEYLAHALSNGRLGATGFCRAAG